MVSLPRVELHCITYIMYRLHSSTWLIGNLGCAEEYNFVNMFFNSFSSLDLMCLRAIETGNDTFSCFFPCSSVECLLHCIRESAFTAALYIVSQPARWCSFWSAAISHYLLPHHMTQMSWRFLFNCVIDRTSCMFSLVNVFAVENSADFQWR